MLPTISELIPANSPNSLTCIFQPTDSSKTRLGVGLYSECAYSAGKYTIKAPIGGLSQQ